MKATYISPSIHTYRVHSLNPITASNHVTSDDDNEIINSLNVYTDGSNVNDSNNVW